MSQPDFTYREDQLLPPLGFHWKEYVNGVETTIDFTVPAHTFTMELVDYDNVKVMEKTTGIDGTNGFPNVIASPEAGDWNGLAGKRYMIILKAYPVGGGGPRIFRPDNPPTIEITPTSV